MNRKKKLEIKALQLPHENPNRKKNSPKAIQFGNHFIGWSHSHAETTLRSYGFTVHKQFESILPHDSQGGDGRCAIATTLMCCPSFSVKNILEQQQRWHIIASSWCRLCSHIHSKFQSNVVYLNYRYGICVLSRCGEDLNKSRRNNSSWYHWFAKRCCGQHSVGFDTVFIPRKRSLRFTRSLTRYGYFGRRRCVRAVRMKRLICDQIV